MNETIKAYAKLMRVGNLAFIAILLYAMESWVAVPLLRDQSVMPWWVLSLLILSVVCVAAGGYVINDYFDVKIDRINRPDDLIVTHIISRDGAMRLFQILTLVGVGCGAAVSWWAHSWNLLFIYIVIPGLLWFYSASYKRMFLLGNIIVAFVSAIVPLLVAIANADHLLYLSGTRGHFTPVIGDLYVWLSGFAAFAFLITLPREMVKDIEDIEGDREYECRTIPIVLGIKTTKIIVTVLLSIAVILVNYIVFSILPLPHNFYALSTRFAIFGIGIPAVSAIFLLWAAKTTLEYHRVQLIIKFVMFIGTMFSYVIYANLMA